MTLKFEFSFIGEGSTDDLLISHIATLCVKHGADEARGIPLKYEWLRDKPGHRVEDKVEAAAKLEPGIQAIFIHRDSDGRDGSARRAEIALGVQNTGIHIPFIAVVPIQETEAWLLTSENEIRQVVGNSSGTMDLGIPKVSRIESTASPKETLKHALATASGASGRRLVKIKKSFGAHRASLIERLDIDGPVTTLSAWMKLEADIKSLITALSAP